ncbi:MAG: hypothetical protein KJ711_00545 [Candidatus Omnitrophica bacterium]|nr:hypothetical protein [Candidatus Omnitrophota bacterium]MBU1523124.1 hypothetical protein [Candidatus Omnitrophota bacterium]
MRKAQSTLEYVIILSVVIGSIMWAAAAVIRPAVRDSISHVSDQMEAQVQEIEAR